MKSLRAYIDILSEDARTPAEIAASADLLSANNAGNINAGLTPDDPRWQGPKPAGQGATPAAQPAAQPAANNPWAPKQDTTKQDAWAKLSPEQQKWLGGADPTDPIIAARMRAAVPDKAPVAGPATGADMDVATQGAGGPAPVATATPVAQGNAEATPLPGQGATPANRDSMPFSAAFADARKKGEAKFSWKGKDYTTQVAAAKPAAAPAAPQLPKADQAQNNAAQAIANSSIAPGYGQKGPTVAAAQGKDAANPLNQTAPGAGATPTAPAPAAPAANPNAAKIQAEIDRFTKSNNMSYQSNKDYVAKLQSQLGAPVKESAYDEVERLVSLIHYR